MGRGPSISKPFTALATSSFPKKFIHPRGGWNEVCANCIFGRRRVGNACNHSTVLHFRSSRKAGSASSNPSWVLLRFRNHGAHLADCFFRDRIGSIEATASDDSFVL